MDTQSKDAIEQNPNMKQYFSSLPVYVQETIKQTAVKICSESDLHQCAENLTRKPE